ncbi:hypothetical protein FC52_GL000214 [Lactobacillus pasteurii DSM 23907 = CRBIP 24.76]|uniref:Conserved secreted or membrane protein n=1 Tax=Lactobacillus pasteurii DSM 23907 = CRBIP 24.76 TaxID=1423790 RepID=I7LBI7_9LACO|nr:hypothetical protein [Lactobacillus pasteurii]KRK08516.1 hypothetical protein FC52_GL000214 [Lactobacillus pasteurii DSM 23907 = CRBIP 24.76]TDG75695.1 hypothetical protein C5L33_000580 [Lactobacillus pasteurii]CCI85621.1 Conserved secreted or membrane protein [Lactobacillus pasteurii DSM 23907 = CRBIP 24.76]
MRQLIRKIKENSFIKKLNSFYAMPVVWWSLLLMLLPYLSSLLRIPIVFRVGVVCLIIGNIISFHVGFLINRLKLKSWWLLVLPALFCLAVLPTYAKYNLLFGIIFLIFELFGQMNKQIYR